MKTVFSFLRLSLGLLAGILLGSCMQEPSPGRVLSAEEQAACMEYAEVGFSLGNPSFDFDVEQTKGQALAGADNMNLGGALVLIYRHATQTLDSYEWFTPVQLASGVPLTVRVPLVPCDVYVLGNLVAVKKADASVTANLKDALGDSFPATESALENFVYRLDGGSLNGVASSTWRTETMDEVRQYGVPYQFVEKDVDMYSVFHDGLPFPSGKASWLFSKVTVTVDHTAFDGGAYNFEDYFRNNAIYVRQPNLKLTPFSTAASSAVAEADRGTSDADGDRDVSMSQAHAGSYVFFVPENMMGTVPTVDDSSKKNKDNADIPSSVRDFASFVEFRGTLGTAAGGFSGDVRYQFYLGGNETSDFNLQRGKAYNVTLQFTIGNLFGSPKWMVTPTLSDNRRFQITADSSFSTDIETVNSSRLLAVRKNRPGKVYVYMNAQDQPSGTNSLIGKDVVSPSSFSMDDLGDCSWYGDFMSSGTSDAVWLADRGIVPVWNKVDGSLTFSVPSGNEALFNAHLGEEKTLTLRLLPLETRTATVKVRLVDDIDVSVGDGKSLTDGFYLGQKRTVTATGFNGTDIRWAAVQEGCGDVSHTNANEGSNRQWKVSSSGSAAFPSCAVTTGGKAVFNPLDPVYDSQVFTGSLDLYAFYPNRFQSSHSGWTSKGGKLVIFGSDWLNDCVELSVVISEPYLKTAFTTDDLVLPLDGTPRAVPEFGYMDFAGSTRLDIDSFDATLYNSLLAFGKSTSGVYGECIGVDPVTLTAYCCQTTYSGGGDLLTLTYNAKGVTTLGEGRSVYLNSNTSTGLWGSFRVFNQRAQYSKLLLLGISNIMYSSVWTPAWSKSYSSFGESTNFTVDNYFKGADYNGRDTHPFKEDSKIGFVTQYNFVGSDLSTMSVVCNGGYSPYTSSHGEVFAPVWDLEMITGDSGSTGTLSIVFDEAHQAKADSYGEAVPGGLIVPYGVQHLRYMYTNRWDGRDIEETGIFSIDYYYDLYCFVGITHRRYAELHLVTPKQLRYLTGVSMLLPRSGRTYLTKLFGSSAGSEYYVHAAYAYLDSLHPDSGYVYGYRSYFKKYTPHTHFPMKDFDAYYVDYGSTMWSYSLMNKLLTGNLPIKPGESAREANREFAYSPYLVSFNTRSDGQPTPEETVTHLNVGNTFYDLKDYFGNFWLTAVYLDITDSFTD